MKSITSLINLKNIMLLALLGILLINNISALKNKRSVLDASYNEEENFLETSSGKEELEYAVPAANATAPAVMSAEGWLKISSQEFRNVLKFPTLEINGKKFTVKIDKRFFRINSLYDPKKKGADEPKSHLDFYFRLVKNLLYYTVSKKDVNMLGSIEIVAVEPKTLFLPGQSADGLCFTVKDTLNGVWDICADDKKTADNFICKIKTSMGNKCDDNLTNSAKNNTNLEVQTYQPVIVVPIPAKECNANWNYDLHGNDFECICKEGIEQSPIDIPEISNIIESPVTPYFEFRNVAAKSPISSIDGELKTNENVKVKYMKNAVRILHNDFGKIVTLDGSVYQGEEVVFHTPSEHKIGGKQMDMEMQVIYYGKSKGDIAKQVVLSFLFEQRPGIYNRFLEDVDIFNLPSEASPEKDLKHDLFIPKIFSTTEDEEDFNQRPFSFYTYQGSITAPPCTEGTIHYVASDPIPIGSVVVQLFREALKKEHSLENGILENNRKTQPLNGRKVFFYDKDKYAAEPVIPHDHLHGDINGHYEKIHRERTMYQWVNNGQPSKFPGALVVPQREVEKILRKSESHDRH